jgi:hypothetical protein
MRRNMVTVLGGGGEEEIRVRRGNFQKGKLRGGRAERKEGHFTKEESEQRAERKN